MAPVLATFAIGTTPALAGNRYLHIFIRADKNFLIFLPGRDPLVA